MGLFRNGSKRTNSQQKDALLKPITLRLGADMALKTTFDTLPGFCFDIVRDRPDYHEIYAVKGTIEYTFSFIEDFGKTHLSILAFSEKTPLKIKKNLKELMMFLRDKLEMYIE
ncbi:MAG: hypothetical protein IJQ67_04285 [Bacilli bacterium]|nr:hypothetical protein [Bacilli bacterium]